MFCHNVDKFQIEKNILNAFSVRFVHISDRSKNQPNIALNLKTYNDLPGPLVLPIIGSLLSVTKFTKDQRNYLRDAQSKFGDLIKWQVFNQKQVITFNADHVKKIYNLPDNSPIKLSLPPLEEYRKFRNMPYSLNTAEGEKWRQLRSSNNLVVKPQTVINYLPKNNTVLRNFIQYLKNVGGDKSEFQINAFEELIKPLNLELVSIMAFDERINCIDEKKRTEEAKLFIKHSSTTLIYAGKLFYSVLWKFYPTKDWKLFVESMDFIYGIGRKYVNQAHNKVKLLSKEELEVQEKTILNELLINKDKYKTDLTETLSFMVDMLGGGIDTTSITLHFLFYELGINQNVQQELYEEISKVCKINEDMTDDNLSKMPYLKATLKESLRLHALGTLNGRKLKEDIILDDYLIPKDTTVFFAHYTMSESEKYFKNPLEFNPKRWFTDKDSIHGFSSLPFGHGPRMCIGRRLAEQNIYLIVARILQHYRIECVGEKVNPKFELTMVPDKSINLKFFKRN